MLLPICDDGFISDEMTEDGMSMCSSIGLAACPSPVAKNYLELRSLYQTPVESEAESSLAGSRANVFPTHKELLLNGVDSNRSFYHRANTLKARRLARGSSLNCSREDDLDELVGNRGGMRRSAASVPSSLAAAAQPLKASPESLSIDGDLSVSDVEDVIGVLTRALTRAEKRGLIVTANSKSLPCSPALPRARSKMHANGPCRVVGIKKFSNVVVDDDSLMDITVHEETPSCVVKPKPQHAAKVQLVQSPPCELKIHKVEVLSPSVKQPPLKENGVLTNGISNGYKSVAFAARRNSKSMDRLRPKESTSVAQRRSRSSQREEDSSSSERPPKRRQDSQTADRPNTLKISLVPLKHSTNTSPVSGLPPSKATDQRGSRNVLPQSAKQVAGSASVRKRVQREVCEVMNSGGVGLHHSIKRPHDMVIQLFESAVCLYLGEDHLVSARNLGSMDECLRKLEHVDNSLVMGHVLRNIASLMEGSGVSKQALQTMMDMCQTQRADSTTQLHVKATLLASQGYLDRAVSMWEEILDKEPLNILAVKFAHEGHVRMGMLSDMVTLTSKILDHWKPVMPFYGQILNLHSFSLCENGKQDDAETFAKQSQDLDGTSLEAIHSMLHVHYTRNEHTQGIELLRNTKSLWIDSERLACHYLWHWVLFHIKRRDFTVAMEMWDSEIKPRALAAKPNYVAPLLDAASLLMRLSMHGMSLQQRWSDLHKVLCRHLKDHLWVMNDLHIIMVAMGTNDSKLVRSFKDSIQIYIQTGKGTNHKVTKEVGLTLCEAMVCYGAANHERVVDLTYPIRGQIHRIGGTQAQRDIFHEILISSAGKSRMPSHQKLVRQLMEERRVP